MAVRKCSLVVCSLDRPVVSLMPALLTRMSILP
jgi:hypothetical protein